MIFILLILTGLLAYVTKPSDDSFGMYIQNDLKDNSDLNALYRFATGLTAKWIANILDCGVLKIADVKVGDHNYLFVGAFQNWFPLGKVNNTAKN